MTPDELAKKYDFLCRQGVHNINFVTPTHVIPVLLEAWLSASPETQKLPLVYNTSGYDSLDLLKLLDGIIDIYLPDIKYSNDSVAMELSKAPDFVNSNRAAISEMYRQCGKLKINKNGIATKGIIIRHLVLPHNLSGSRESFEWIKKNLGTDVHISLMSQYFPTHNAASHPKINRPITDLEYSEVIQIVENLGFTNVWAQDPTATGGA
jgi:putative pyruvate formate lyase activating enzyme